MKNKWVAETNNKYAVTVIATRSFEDEFMRGVIRDLPLLSFVFVVMCSFTCLVFSRPCDSLNSRCLLGFGSVVCVLDKAY